MSDEVLIIIKKSKLRGAGEGAFAGTFIHKDDELGEYTGKKLTESQFKLLKNTNYIFEVTKSDGTPFYIDARDPDTSSWIRYVNGAKTKKQREKINTGFYQYRNRIFLRAVKDIPVGTELVSDYGEYYW